MSGVIRIGSRGSALAGKQAEIVMGKIEKLFPGVEMSHRIISTVGDRSISLPLHRIDAVGLFVKEIEDALLRGEIDLAVHSLKDMPVEIPEGLTIASVLERDDSRDAIISRGNGIERLDRGASIGTSSLRRGAQIRRVRPDLEVVNIRGNIGTRLAKLDRGECDAIILAACGLDRIGLSERITERIRPEIMLPAPCQGILAVEARADDEFSVDIANRIGDQKSMLQAETERSFSANVEGGCRVPIACASTIESERVTIEALIASIDGTAIVRDRISGLIGERLDLAQALAYQMLSNGGDAILETARLES